MKTRNPHHITDLSQAYEGKGDEDQFAKAERQARELVEDSDRIMAATRREDARKRQWRAAKPRLDALRAMGRWLAINHRDDDAAAWLRSLRADPTFKALPAAQQKEWEAAVPEWVELSWEGSMGEVHKDVHLLADQQSEVDWEVPEAELETPADLAAMVPRG